VTSLIGPNAPISIPKVAQPVQEHLPDYEVELTVVMGKDAKNVSEEDALDYVLGYVTGNDVGYSSFDEFSKLRQIVPRFHSVNTNWQSPNGVSAKALTLQPHSVRALFQQGQSRIPMIWG
jgi:hypothetical protein